MLLGVLAAATAALMAASAAIAAAPPGRAYEKVTPAGKAGGEVAAAWHARPSSG